MDRISNHTQHLYFEQEPIKIVEKVITPQPNMGESESGIWNLESGEPLHMTISGGQVKQD